VQLPQRQSLRRMARSRIRISAQVSDLSLTRGRSLTTRRISWRRPGSFSATTSTRCQKRMMAVQGLQGCPLGRSPQPKMGEELHRRRVLLPRSSLEKCHPANPRNRSQRQLQRLPPWEVGHHPPSAQSMMRIGGPRSRRCRKAAIRQSSPGSLRRTRGAFRVEESTIPLAARSRPLPSRSCRQLPPPTRSLRGAGRR
jgi:hypothetical protein